MREVFLVTGGSGFIGSEAVRELILKGFKVYNIDKLTYASSQEALLSINKDDYIFFEGDISKKEDVKNIIELSKPNYILNFAAESHVDRSIVDPDEFINTNIYGTYCLLEGSYEYWSNLKDSEKNKFKFVHISTDEVYGSLNIEDQPFSEASQYQPNSPYSASKASSDMLVRSWNKTYNLPINITHSSNNYGHWQYPEKLIPLTLNKILNLEPIPIYGDGENIRDWIYVKDNIDAIISITLNAKSGEVYNIGGNSEISNIDLVNKLCSIMDRKLPKVNGSYSDLITFVSDRPGHDFRYAINTKKIKDHLDWEPQTDLSTGLDKTVDWILENKDWIIKKSKKN